MKYGSADHKQLLEAGYQMSVEKAETIVKERKENPQSWPYEVFEKASALLEAMKAKPAVISKRQPFKRAIR